eukprot:11722037-Alexandrium_andersonii.AAC.1
MRAWRSTSEQAKTQQAAKHTTQAHIQYPPTLVTSTTAKKQAHPEALRSPLHPPDVARKGRSSHNKR